MDLTAPLSRSPRGAGLSFQAGEGRERAGRAAKEKWGSDRETGLTVGNPAGAEMTGSQSWHGPTASLLLGSPTGLPPHSSSCSPPRRMNNSCQRGRGGQRAEVGGLFAKTARN